MRSELCVLTVTVCVLNVTDRVRPASNRICPNSNRGCPESNRVCPELNRICPESNRARPESNRARPKLNCICTESNFNIPNQTVTFLRMVGWCRGGVMLNGGLRGLGCMCGSRLGEADRADLRLETPTFLATISSPQPATHEPRLRTHVSSI
jgi:hypothetical protein